MSGAGFVEPCGETGGDLVEDVLIIGANLEDTGFSDAGAAYLFGRDSVGGWVQADILMPPTPIRTTGSAPASP